MAYNPLLAPLTDFPANAKEGDIIFHGLLKDIFKCVHGAPVFDTTQKGNWIAVTSPVRGTEIISEGVERGKVLMSDGLGTSIFSDLDGGAI